MRTTSDEMYAKSQNDCIHDLMSFLVWAEYDGVSYGGTSGAAALESVQVMLGYDDGAFEKLKKVFSE